MADGNGNYGITFTIKAVERDIMVTSLDFNTDSNSTVDVKVYTRPGLFNKKDMKTADKWTMSSSTTVTGYGAGQMTAIPEESFTPVSVPKDQFQTFYVTLATKEIRYSNASSEFSPGDVFISDKFLEFYVGKGVGEPFLQNMFGKPARIFNGALHYIAKVDDTTPSPTPAPILPWIDSFHVDQGLTTTFQGGSGAYGCMFEIRALTDLVIRNIEIRMNEERKVAIEVFTKSDTYVGFESNQNAWKSVANVMVDGQGPDTSTPVPSDSFDDVAVPSGMLQSFYVTLRSPDIILTQLTAEDKLERGSVLVHDSNMQILVGDGLGGYKFTKTLPRRIFNGKINYSTESSMSPAIAPMVTPAPTWKPVEISSAPYSAASAQPQNLKLQISGPPSPVIENAVQGSSKPITASPSNKKRIAKPVVSSSSTVAAPSSNAKAGQVISQQLIEISGVSDNRFRQLVTHASDGRLLLTPDAVDYFQKVTASFLQGSADPKVIKITNVIVSTDITSKDVTLRRRTNELMLSRSAAYGRSSLVTPFVERVAVDLNSTLNETAAKPVDGNPTNKNQTSSESIGKKSLGLYTTIAGDYHPPPNIDFNSVVGKSFNDKESSAEFLGELKKESFFANATGVSSTPVKFPLPAELMELIQPSGMSQLTLYLIYGGCGLGIALVICFFTCIEYRKRRKRLNESKERLATNNTVYSQVSSSVEAPKTPVYPAYMSHRSTYSYYDSEKSAKVGVYQDDDICDKVGVFEQVHDYPKRITMISTNDNDRGDKVGVRDYPKRITMKGGDDY